MATKKLPKWAVTVTPFSKYLALTVFIILPFIGFYLGVQYQKKLSVENEGINSNTRYSAISNTKKLVSPTVTSFPNPTSSHLLASNVPMTMGGIVAYFGPKGNQVTYSDGNTSVYLNGVKGKAYDEVGLATFSPDDNHFAYFAKEKNKSFIVRDGIEGRAYDSISDILFSSDSKHLAYVAERNGKWIVVIDDEEGKMYDNISNVIFNPESFKISYTVEKNGQKVIVYDGKEERPYEDIDDGSHYPYYLPVFSKDGKHMLYLAHKNGLDLLVLDGNEIKSYQNISDPIFSPDGNSVAYVLSANEQSFVVLGNKEFKHFWIIESGPFFSPDGHHIAFTALAKTNANKLLFLIDNSVIKTCDYSYFKSPAYAFFNNDGQTVAFACLQNNIVYFENGNKESQFPNEFKSEGVPVFSPDGKHVAFKGYTKEGYVIIVDGIEQKKYSQIFTAPIFSPDSQFVEYGAAVGNKLWWIANKISQ